MTGSSIARSPSSGERPPRERIARARQDDLLRRIVVGDGEPVGAGELVGVFGGARAEQRQHPPVAGAVTRFLHQPATERDQLEAVALCEAAGRDQRADSPSE